MAPVWIRIAKFANLQGNVVHLPDRDFRNFFALNYNTSRGMFFTPESPMVTKLREWRSSVHRWNERTSTYIRHRYKLDMPERYIGSVYPNDQRHRITWTYCSLSKSSFCCALLPRKKESSVTFRIYLVQIMKLIRVKVLLPSIFSLARDNFSFVSNRKLPDTIWSKKMLTACYSS